MRLLRLHMTLGMMPRHGHIAHRAPSLAKTTPALKSENESQGAACARSVTNKKRCPEVRHSDCGFNAITCGGIVKVQYAIGLRVGSNLFDH